MNLINGLQISFSNETVETTAENTLRIPAMITQYIN
jgi:hypothetical protein